jgi:[glutamine synthetase] adenylyltransferase / [glutamine synthetase]-adenylyl-L-tyrosine phosphorylase
MTSAIQQDLREEIHRLPPALIEPVTRWFERLGDEIGGEPTLGPDSAYSARLVKLIACSEFAGNVIIRDCAWFFAELESGRIQQGFSRESLVDSLRGMLESASDLPDAKRVLREFRNRQMLGILWREIGGVTDLSSTLASLSDLADVLIECTSNHVRAGLGTRFGEILAKDGCPMSLIVLAMGKLGGQELNFSSDVDLVFVYPADGESNGHRQLSANEYFTRWARQLVALLDETTEHGFVYRVDTRLRPFGDSGPLVVSLAALEAYLMQHGRSWERYAYVKARIVGQCSNAGVADELMEDLIRPFVYRQYLDYGIFESLRDMKALITAEVRSRELASNIKLGPGGIREIEFIVQSLQLVRGGADRKLRERTLLRVLPQLAHGGGLKSAAASALAEAYRFLRRLENFMQAIRDRQTHDLPENDADRQRIALAMGHPEWQQLESDLQKYRTEVGRQFSEIAFRGDSNSGRSELAQHIAGLWDGASSAAEWSGSFSEMGLDNPEALSSVMEAFSRHPAMRQIDSVSRRRAGDFISALIPQLKKSKRPAVALERILKISEQIVRRSAYLALLNENPNVLERLVSLCEGSAFLAGEIARFPVLLDEMIDPGCYSGELSADDMRADLHRRFSAMDEHDSEQRIETLAQFQRAMIFRIAVADFSGSLPIMKVSDRLTELAELVLNSVLDVAWSDVSSRHGEPWFDAGDGPRWAGFGIIAYGKLGGMELSYGSDLDLVFLHDSQGIGQQTNGERSVENSVFFARLVRRLVHFLTTQTGSGVLYQVDTRLRPDGQSGLLVTSVEAFERYQEANAWTWEHQALLRSRPVAGSATVARDFERVRSDTLRHRIRRDQLLPDVLTMRRKMRKQLDKSTAGQFDLKQGEGGIGDIEFIVQYLVLKNAADHPAVMHYTDNIRQLGTLCAAGCLDEVDAHGLQQIYKDYRLRLHRLVLDGQPPMVGMDEFHTERDEVCAIWAREMAGPASSTLL